MNSIIEESKKARRNGLLGLFRNKKIMIAAAILAAAGLGAFFYYGRGQETASVAQARNYTVDRGDIKLSIESEGKVVAKDGVELSFSVNEDSLEVENVFVKEGQAVKKGDKIASVKTNTLELSVRSAYASYLSALAAYNEKVAGATDEEKAKARDAIETAELSLSQSKISLEKAKTSAASAVEAAEKTAEDAKEEWEKNESLDQSESVGDAYEGLVDALKSTSIPLGGILDDSDAIIGVDDRTGNDDFEFSLAASDPGLLVRAQGSYKAAKASADGLAAAVMPLSRLSPRDAVDAAADLAETALSAMETHLYDMQAMLNASITGTELTQSELDSFKSAVSANRTSINSKRSSLSAARKAAETAVDDLGDFREDYDDAVKNLADAKVDAEQDIANAETTVRNRELSLAQAKRDYDELLQPLTDSELKSARSQLTSASVALERAQEELGKATIVTPIDGEVAALNYAAGDIIVDSSTAKPAATIINKNTLYIEVNIEEADINKLKAGQAAVAAFDALEGVELKGEISFISLTSETDNNGIVTYLVRVVFDDAGQEAVREGMTAYVEFVTGGVEDVLQVPVDAVRNVAGKPSVQLADGSWAPVVTGFTDGKAAEIVSGVAEGERIVY